MRTPPEILKKVEGIVNDLRALMLELEDEERAQLPMAVMEGYCFICGQDDPNRNCICLNMEHDLDDGSPNYEIVG